MEIRRQTDVFPADKYPDVKPDPNTFFVDFSLRQRICDIEPLPFSFLIQEKRDISVIKVISIHMYCNEFAMDEVNSNVKLIKAIEKYQPKLQEIFEGEVIEKLRQNSSQ